MDISLLYIVLSLASLQIAQAVTRRTYVGSPLHLECRDNQTIKINNVMLGKETCIYQLRQHHDDYIRVVTQCSGLKSCSNIILRESTRIPCTHLGLVDSSFMEVDYTCIADHSKMSICHNTLRTTSPFSGYIASPEYPQIPNIDLNSGANRQEVEATNNIDMLCQCEISGLSSSAQIELSLLDMYNSDQVELSDPGGNTRYMCTESSTGRCINDIYTSEYSTVNITYRPHMDDKKNTKFLLQYSAVGKRSRVRAVCSVKYISITRPVITTEATQGVDESLNNEKEEVELLEDNVMALEVIVIICIGAVLFIVIVIIIALICRRRCMKKRDCNQTVFKIFSADGNPTYDMVPDENHYATIPAKNSKGEYDHVYHEPGDAGYREYSEPCTEYDYSGAEYKVGSAADSTIPVKVSVTNAEDNKFYFSGAASETSGIYESLEHLTEDPVPPQRQSRLSRMKKSSSMPQHPAPPLPRGAIQKLNSRLNPDSNSQKDHQNSCKSSTGASNSPNQSVAGASNHSHYDVPKPQKSGSMESIPRLDMDLDCADIIRETDRRLQLTPQEPSIKSTPREPDDVIDSEYMLPVNVEVLKRPEPCKPSKKKGAGCKLIENELYIPEKA